MGLHSTMSDAMVVGYMVYFYISKKKILTKPPACLKSC